VRLAVPVGDLVSGHLSAQHLRPSFGRRSERYASAFAVTVTRRTGRP
jgi:hypothetical protein